MTNLSTTSQNTASQPTVSKSTTAKNTTRHSCDVPVVVFAGAGDLAQRAIADLQTLSQAAAITAIARSAKVIAGAQFIQGDLLAARTQEAIAALQPSVIVVTLVPNGGGESGYQQGYIAPLQALLARLTHGAQGASSGPSSPFIIFASSTGVYHQTDGSWVDEHSATSPAHFSGQCMLQAEQLLEQSGLPYCSVRFGGIYGPGRDFLIKQVQAGHGGGPEFTNRIHQHDAGRCLSFLVQQVLQGRVIPKVLLGCDSAPVSSQTVRQFIAQQLGLASHALTPSASGRGGNKRCSNKALLALGFELHYPSFEQGYLME
ncbi:hypothetical protein [Marinagarivorans algicola]|uniref:hypothetical protein n=1 Tax=Marinagarivorans algicola TaxID=1513270 RepID=UPI0006B53073|nr:hypothetical protein [Marinagarivorans algicola]